MMSQETNDQINATKNAAVSADSIAETQSQQQTEGQPATESAEAPAQPPAPALSADDAEQLKAKAAKADEYWDRVLRISAELENFRKRSARERQDAVRYANAALLEKLVSVLDHFDMALAATNNADKTTVESFKTGIVMIHNQLKNVLTEAGLEPIDAAGQQFDPNWHEAVSQQETTDTPEGTVVQQLRKGYKLRDRLIRPASVVVAKTPHD